MEFVDTFVATTTADTKVCVIIDSDDPQYVDYVNLLDGYKVEYYVAPPTNRGMVGALNAGFHDLNEENLLGFSVGFMGDDHRPRTVGWDTHYLEALREMNSGFVYGNDLFQGERMPTQVAMTTDIPKILEWMSPPSLDHLCVDLVWKDLGEGINRIKYLPDVIVEHMHPLAGKARMDKGYAAVNNNEVANHDSEAYRRYVDHELEIDVNLLRGTLGI